MVWGGDRVELGPGDLVSLRSEHRTRDAVVPLGTRGTVLDVGDEQGDARVIEVELPVLVGGRQSFVVARVPRSQCWLQWQFAPTRPGARRVVREARPPARGDWSRLIGEVVVTRGARLTEVVEVGPGEALAGVRLPVGVHGTIVAYEGKRAGQEVFTVHFTLPGAGHHGYVSVTLRRRQFELVDPALARPVQALAATIGLEAAASR